MIVIDGQTIKAAAFEKPYTSAMGKESPAEHPKNCRSECPYGHDRAFCFPCYKKIMDEHRKAKKQIAKEA